MADTKFMDFAEVTPSLSDSVLVANEANGVRRSKISTMFSEILGQVLSLNGIRWNIESPNIGFISLGKFFGNLTLEFLYFNTNVSNDQNSQEKTLPVTLKRVCYAHATVVGVENNNTKTTLSFSPNNSSVVARFNVGKDKSYPIYGIIIGFA